MNKSSPMFQFSKAYTADMAKELAKILKDVGGKAPVGSGEFEVIASTASIDRQGESILVAGWDTKDYMNNPVVLYGHDYWSLPIGAVTALEFTEEAMIAKGVFADTEMGQTIRKLYDDGILKAVSVGFMPLERNGNIISKASLLEISFVPVPANAEALSLAKAMMGILKTAVAPQDTDTAPEDAVWDAPTAVANIEEWAEGESDGGDDETDPADESDIDFSKYQQGFAWFDPANSKDTTGYKFPHHDILDNNLVVNWLGVQEAMQDLLAGTTEIPEEERQGVYDHLAGHYKQFSKEPPEFKSYTPYELDQIFPVKAEEGEKTVGDAKALLELKGDLVALIDGALARVKGGKVVQSAEAKEGRVLSQKNRLVVGSAIEAIKNCTSALQELLDATESPKEHVADSVKDLMKLLQGLDKTIEGGIIKAKETYASL